MKALVTGCNGFAGKHLLKHLLAEGDIVVGASRTQVKSLDGVEVHQLDLGSEASCEALLRKVNPDVIYHLAAVAFVPDAEANFLGTLEANVLGTSNLVRACKVLSAPPRFVFPSSSEVYGKVSVENLPIPESAPLKPANNYSISKAMAEMVIGRYAREGIIVPVIFRPFNHIGPGQSTNFVIPSFASQIASAIKKGGPGKIRVGNLEAKRDFSDVRDIVKGYRLGAIKGNGTYNLGSGKAHTIESLLKKLIELSGIKIDIEIDPTRLRGPEVLEFRADASKAKKDLGWETTISIEDSLKEILFEV